MSTFNLTDSSGNTWQIAVTTTGDLQATQIATAPVAPATGITTTTVSQIIADVSQDIRGVLGTTGGDAAILIDWVDRVSREMLREARWKWLLSTPQRFVTQLGVNDYWFGATGGQPTGAFDTGLNITDFDEIKADTVYDRSYYRTEGGINQAPLLPGFAYQDGQYRLGPPKVFKSVPEFPNLLSLYPAPDNQNSYQPVPNSPICTTAVSGALANRIYYVKASFVDSNGGESFASATPAIAFVPANSVLKVKSPNPILTKSASGVLYSKYRVYASTISGSETLQSTSTTIGTDWTEPNTGLVAGATLPASNTIEPMRGSLIAFQYYKAIIPLTSSSQVLQIPDSFKDVVVAGVNSIAANYLKQYQEAGNWQSVYRNGLKVMIRRKNLFPQNSSFMRPDPASR